MTALNIDSLIDIARGAGKIILKHYKNNSTNIYTKNDKSPVTDADLQSNDYIIQNLKKIDPITPIITEEAKIDVQSSAKIPHKFWIIDPLDGTRGFIEQNDQFTVNIALIENQEPILGIVYLPVSDTVYFASKQLRQSFKQVQNFVPLIINCLHHVNKKLTIAINQSQKIPTQMQNLDYTLEVLRLNAAGKFGLVADGSADLYFRTSPTCEWDTAAGHCVVKFAGGKIIDLQGQELKYGKKDFLNPGFICLGNKNINLDTILNLLT